MVNRDCDCCGNIELRKVYSYYYKVMTRKGQLEWEVKNVVCKKCGFVFVSPVPDEKTLSEFYENQYDKFEIEEFLNSIAKVRGYQWVDIHEGILLKIEVAHVTERI